MAEGCSEKVIEERLNALKVPVIHVGGTQPVEESGKMLTKVFISRCKFICKISSNIYMCSIIENYLQKNI